MNDKTPCVDCHYCFPIDENDGQCDFENEPRIVYLYDYPQDCPAREEPKKEE